MAKGEGPGSHDSQVASLFAYEQYWRTRSVTVDQALTGKCRTNLQAERLKQELPTEEEKHFSVFIALQDSVDLTSLAGWTNTTEKVMRKKPSGTEEMATSWSLTLGSSLKCHSLSSLHSCYFTFVREGYCTHFNALQSINSRMQGIFFGKNNDFSFFTAKSYTVPTSHCGVLVGVHVKQ